MNDFKEREALPDKAEELLRSWPDAPRSDADFERMARAVEARICGQTGSNPPPGAMEGTGPSQGRVLDGADAEGWLFRPPLPLQAGEPRHTAGKQQQNAERPSLSLKEIARAALEANSADTSQKQTRARAPLQSGTRERDDRVSQVNVVALANGKLTPSPPGAAASAVPRAAPWAGTPAGGARRNTTHSKSAASTAASERDASRPGPTEHANTEHTNTGQARAGATSNAESTVGPASAHSRRWLWSTLAAAAAMIVYVGWSANRQPEPVVVGQHAETATEAVAAAASESKSTGSASPDPVAAERPGDGAQPSDDGEGSSGAGEALALDAPATQARSITDLPTERAATGAAAAKGRTALRPRAPATEAVAEAVEAPHGATAEAVTEAAPEEEPALVPAAGTSGAPSHPSIGAAQGAVGSVLGAARACVAGQFSPSKAEVVFGSDGRVLRVGVTGPAQGTPAEACIASAMRGARVRPFTDETFSVRTTVRP